mmetsp:Transcript_49598/g.91511  ORF Transcript_49598/g.91511 Transcript_49598/m.91511 type:complete len:241 (+) Transcript_49598:585-1307(+)
MKCPARVTEASPTLLSFMLHRRRRRRARAESSKARKSLEGQLWARNARRLPTLLRRARRRKLQRRKVRPKVVRHGDRKVRSHRRTPSHPLQSLSPRSVVGHGTLRKLLHQRLIASPSRRPGVAKHDERQVRQTPLLWQHPSLNRRGEASGHWMKVSCWRIASRKCRQKAGKRDERLVRCRRPSLHLLQRLPSPRSDGPGNVKKLRLLGLCSLPRQSCRRRWTNLVTISLTGSLISSVTAT